MTNITPPSGAPQEWFELDSKRKAIDPNRFLEEMAILRAISDVKPEEAEWVEHAFSQISKAKFDDPETTDKVKELSKQISNTWTKATMGTHHVHIPKEHFKDLGPKFKAQFSHKLFDADLERPELKLDVPEEFPFAIPPNVEEGFLKYLQTGKLEIITPNEADLMTLLLLARLQAVTPLIEECQDLLKEQLSWENLSPILEFAVEQQLPELQYDCLIFAQEYSDTKPADFECIQKDLLTLPQTLKSNGILLSRSPSGGSQVTLTRPLDQTSKDPLTTINNLSPLESLIVTKDFTTDPMEALVEFTSLKSLTISDNKRITNKSLAHLKHLVKLQKLDVSSCADITDDGLAHLKHLVDLQELCLTGCSNITDDGLAHIAKLVNLQELTLWKCENITDDGLTHIAKLINLQKLGLPWSSKITDDGLAHIAKLVKLQELNLWNCEKITDDGLAHIAKLVNLQKLNIKRCKKITKMGRAHLIKHLTNLKFL